MRGQKLLMTGALVLALSLGSAACGDDDDGGSGGSGGSGELNLTIGALLPETGDLAAYAPAGAKAFELAIDELNSALGDSGVTVDSLSEDTQTTPQGAQQAARKAIADGATCLVGPWASGEVVPVGQSVASREEVPLFSPSGTAAEITELPDDGYVNRIPPSDGLQAKVLADYVEEELGGADGTISVAGRNDPYGEGLANSFAEEWEAKGGTVTGPVIYDLEQPSYNSEAADIVADTPDAFVIVDFEEPYNKLGAALTRTGDFDPTKLFVTDGLAFEDGIPDSIPDEALDGALGTRPTSAESTSGEDFDKLYTGAGSGPKDRGTFDAENFDAAMLCALAAVAADSTDGPAIADELATVSGPPGDKYDYTELAGAVEALQSGDDIDFDGVTGPIDLDENGDPLAGTYQRFSYEGGEFKIGETIEQAGE